MAGEPADAGTGSSPGQPGTVEPEADELAAKPADGPASSEEVGSLRSDTETLEFELAVEVIYHRSREAWFRGWHRAVLFLTVLLGAGSVAEFVPATFTGLAVTFLGALDLAIGLSASADAHASFRRQYLRLVRKLVDEQFSEKACRRVRREMLKVSAEEPPAYVAAQDVARDQAIISLGRDPKYLVRVRGRRYWTRHAWRWEGRGA